VRAIRILEVYASCHLCPGQTFKADVSECGPSRFLKFPKRGDQGGFRAGPSHELEKGSERSRHLAPRYSSDGDGPGEHVPRGVAFAAEILEEEGRRELAGKLRARVQQKA
jgi:hypothetical protein